MSRVTALRKKRTQYVRDRAKSKLNHALKRRRHPKPFGDNTMTPKRRAAA
jgi:hypothetical protein